MEDKQSGNGSVLKYRVGKVEDVLMETRKDMVKLHEEHESRLRTIEDFITRENAGGVPMRYIWLIAGVVATIMGGIITAILQFTK